MKKILVYFITLVSIFGLIKQEVRKKKVPRKLSQVNTPNVIVVPIVFGFQTGKRKVMLRAQSGKLRTMKVIYELGGGEYILRYPNNRKSRVYCRIDLTPGLIMQT